jgi:hypothetical protein
VKAGPQPPPAAPGPDPEVETAKVLLALDPFVAGGPEAALPEPRFFLEEVFEVSGPEEHSFKHQIVQEDLTATSKYTISTQDYSPGLLGFLGIGPQQEQHLKSSMTHSGSRKVTVGQEVVTKVSFNAEKGEKYFVEAHYDRVFGTFAFRRGTPGSKPAVEGTVTDENGAPAPGQRVTLLAGGKRFSARTDAQGRYAISSSRVRAGTGTLLVGESRRTVVVRPGVVQRGQDLRVPLRGASRRELPRESGPALPKVAPREVPRLREVSPPPAPLRSVAPPAPQIKAPERTPERVREAAPPPSRVRSIAPPAPQTKAPERTPERVREVAPPPSRVRPTAPPAPQTKAPERTPERVREVAPAPSREP